METALAKPPDNFPFNSSSSSSSSSSLIIIPNGYCCVNNNNNNKSSDDDDDDDDDQVFDIEMISVDGSSSSSSYTSLKDLLTTSPSSSPKNSWKEIPIKDPLLQHAAWAYLQPMPTPHGLHDPTFLHKLKDIIACFNDVVSVLIKGWFVEDRG